MTTWRRAAVSWVVLTVAFLAVDALMGSVHIAGGFLGAAVVALVFSLVNAVLGLVLRVLALPLTVLTLGLFALVVNGALLAVTAGLSSRLDVGGVLQTIVAAVLLSLFTTVLDLLLPDRVTAGA